MSECTSGHVSHRAPSPWQRDMRTAHCRCHRHTSCCSGEKCRTIIPLESKAFTCALTRAVNLRFQRARGSEIPDVGDATPVEGDEKLPKVIGLKRLKVQEASLEQDNIAQNRRQLLIPSPATARRSFAPLCTSSVHDNGTPRVVKIRGGMICQSPQVHVEEAKMTSQTRRSQWPLSARLLGAEGVTFDKQHMSTRATESGSTNLAVSVTTRAPNNHYNSCEHETVVERVTPTVQNNQVCSTKRLMQDMYPLSDQAKMNT